jgi:hypothetical protein
MVEIDLALGTVKSAAEYRAMKNKLHPQQQPTQSNSTNGPPAKKRRFFTTITNDPAEFCPTVRSEDLIIGKPYPITKLKKVSTKYGESIIAVLEGVNKAEMEYFLPNRIRDTLLSFGDADDMDTDHLNLTYFGKKGNLFDVKITYEL